MSTPYRFTPRVPAPPHPTPGSDYKLPYVKSSRAPVQNPYEKFTQPEFDAWIGGITSALKQALGQEDEEPRPDKRDPKNFVQTQTNLFDDSSELYDKHVEDSFAEVKARRAVGKGKARDPREGPGFGKGDSSNPIDLVSSDEEDAEEVELTITGDFGSGTDDEEDTNLLSDEDYSWERGQASSPPAPSPTPKEGSDIIRDYNDGQGYGSEEYDYEDQHYEEEAQDEEYDDDEYYDEEDGEEPQPQASRAEVIDLSSDEDEMEEDASENEQPPRKIRKVSPQRHVGEEGEPVWSDGEGELDEEFEEEFEEEITSHQFSSTGSSRRVQGEGGQRHSPEVILLEDSDEGQSDEGEASGYEAVGPQSKISKITPKEHAQRDEGEQFSDDKLEDNDREEQEYEEEHEADDDDEETSQIPFANDLTHEVRSEHEQHEQAQVVYDDDDIQEVQPMEDDTSFPPKLSGSPFETKMPEIPDPWSGPRRYAEDYYSGGEVQIPLGERVDAHHLGPNDDDSTSDLAGHRSLGDDVVQPVEENTAFPPSSEAHQTVVDISDPWKGPQLFAEDFYSGGPVRHHGGLSTAHYLGPADVDDVSDLPHNAVTQADEITEDEEMQPQEEDTSFPQGVEESGAMIDIADPWAGPQTFAEDFYSGGDVRTLPGVPINPDLLSGTGDIEDDIDSFLTPGVLTPSQIKETTDSEGDFEEDEENEIIEPPRTKSPSQSRRNMPIPKDAEIIAIDDSDEENDRPVDHEEVDELDQFDEEDELGFQYPDFGEAHQPIVMEIEDFELHSSVGIVPPVQLQQEAPDVDTMNRQFEDEGEEIFDLSQPIDANISVTLGYVEEVEAEETESHTTQEVSNDQEHPEIQLLDEPQDNSVSMEDEREIEPSVPPQTVVGESSSILNPEEEATTAMGDESGVEIGIPPDAVPPKDHDGGAVDLERDVEGQPTLQDENDTMDRSLAEDSNTTGSEPVVSENNTVGTVVSAEEVLQNPADSTGQEEEQAIPSAPDVDESHGEASSTHLAPSAAPAAVTLPPTQTSGQLPTPPSEKNRYVSLPPESRDEPTLESSLRDLSAEPTEAATALDPIDRPSQEIDYVDSTEPAVIESAEFEMEEGTDGTIGVVEDDIDIKSAYTGEDVDDLQFSVEEAMTDGRFTAEPSERQMSLGVVSLPSEETTTNGQEEHLESSQAPPHDEPMDLEVSAPTMSQASEEGLGLDSTMETIEHPTVEPTPRVSDGEDEVVVPVEADTNVVETVNQPISSGVDGPTDSPNSEGKEIPTSSLENAPNGSVASIEVDKSSVSMEVSIETADNSQQALTTIAHPDMEQVDSSTDLTPNVKNNQTSSIANDPVPVDDIHGTNLNMEMDSVVDSDAQETDSTSLPYRAPSTMSQMVLTRQPTDPVLMADPYPYCLSTPDILPYPHTVNHPGELTVGTVLPSTIQTDSETTNSQTLQAVINDELSHDPGVLTPKSVVGSQSDVFAAATEEDSLGEGPSKPTRKRKRATPSVKSTTSVKSQTPTIEGGDGTSPSVTESTKKTTAKKRTKERKSGPANKSSSSKKKSTGNVPETISEETILVNPRLEDNQGASSQSATFVAWTPGSPTHSSAAANRKIFPPGNSSTVVSPAPSHRSFTSQPSPTINKPSVFPNPNAALESLLHAHGQKRKAMLSQAIQQSISPRAQSKLSRFPSAPLIVPSQPSSSKSAISPIDTTDTVTSPPLTPVTAISPVEKPSMAAPSKPVTPLTKANSMTSRPSTRSTPVTRSHCRYHRISLPKEEGGPRVSFLVPGCSLNDKELMDEEEIVDHGDATVDDSRKMLKDIETLGFSLDLIGVLRQLVGLDILREQEIFYLPQPGEVVTRKIPVPKAASTIRAPADGSSHAGSPGAYSSPGPNRPPHSASSWSESPSLSSLLRQPPVVAGSEQAETDPGYLSTGRDFETESDSSEDDPDGPSPSATTTSKSKGKQVRKFKKEVDLTYQPDKTHDDEEESDTHTSTRKRRKSIRGTKRNRDSDAVPTNDGHEREAKKPKTEMDTPLEPAVTPAQNPPLDHI